MLSFAPNATSPRGDGRFRSSVGLCPPQALRRILFRRRKFTSVSTDTGMLSVPVELSQNKWPVTFYARTPSVPLLEGPT
jgi:hypothetical protein